MFSNILVAYDGSKLSEKALSYVRHLVGENTKVEVLHVYQNPVIIIGEAVITTPGMQKDFFEHERQVEEEMKRLSSGIPRITTTIRQGKPAPTILEYARESDSDLIVLGSRGHTAIDELLLGSTSHHVVQHSSVPVLIVK